MSRSPSPPLVHDAQQGALCPASTIIYSPYQSSQETQRHNSSKSTSPTKNKKRRYTGVGVLILTVHNNRPYLLLGREEFKSVKMNGRYVMPLYEEFGGGIQRRNLSLEENACFELQEETSNLFRFINDPSVLNAGVNRSYDIPFKESRMYKMYVVYIENVDHVLPIFNSNRQKIMSQPTSYYKYKSYLEMDELKMVPLSDIQQVINNCHNYICHIAEDTYHNNDIAAKVRHQQSTPYSNHQTHGYQGILCVDNNTYISRRLSQFLNGPTTTTGKSGLYECLDVFQSGFITSRFQSLDGKGLGLRLSAPCLYLDHEEEKKERFINDTVHTTTSSNTTIDTSTSTSTSTSHNNNTNNYNSCKTIENNGYNASSKARRPHLRFLDGTRYCTAMVPH